MSDVVKGIARLLTEDPDVFSKYQDKFRDHTVLDAEVFGEIVGILQQVAKENGLTLDRSRLKVRFNPAGITIKNISLDSPNSATKRKLAQHMAKITGDDNIKHTFNKNLKINLYQAISGQFADRVRDELNLEVTHQAHDPKTSVDSASVLPMATFTQPAVTAEMPEEELDTGEPTGPEPLGGPKVMAPEEEELPPKDSGQESNEESNIGPFGVEEPENEEGEKEAPAEYRDKEDLPTFENINRIANMLTEDPDIFI